MSIRKRKRYVHVRQQLKKYAMKKQEMDCVKDNERKKIQKKESLLNDVSQRWRTTLIRRYETFPVDFAEKAHQNLLNVFERFTSSGCADSNFLKELASTNVNTSAQRLGEMLLFERLEHAGYQPKPSNGGVGPDFWIQQNEKRICIELITPSTGEDEQLKQLLQNDDTQRPNPDNSIKLRNRLLLRVTSAINEKLNKYEHYLKKKVVNDDDIFVIVVNDALLCPDVFFFGVSHNAENGVGGHSLVEHALLGCGPSFWECDEKNKKYALKSTVRDKVENRPEPASNGNPREPVPVNLFSPATDTDTDSSKEAKKRMLIISGVMQVTLREDYGVLMNFRDKAKTQGMVNPGVIVINPQATNRIDNSIQDGLMKVTRPEKLGVRIPVNVTTAHKLVSRD